MCGICGKVDFSGEYISEKLIKDMCNTLIHRGPDEEGVYINGNVGLGQRRLSIIDLTSEASPPLSNEDGSMWVVFNGEIYNHKELRKELKKKGHVFLTQTDTEVIVHLYEEYGIDFLQHLRGMFSIAIWDANINQLIAARDRVGKKPFFYYKSQKQFIFASEIKAIAVDPQVTLEPNYAAIDSYMTSQYVPSPLSAFKDIHKLPAGHFLRISKDSFEVKRYWSPPAPEKSDATFDEAKRGLIELLEESVELRLGSDVPLGALLSGGIDSGLIVSIMSKFSSSPVNTFSIGFDEDDFNELPYAGLVAKKYGTKHHELIVKPNAAEVLQDLIWSFNEPFADPSAIPTYYVSRMAREHVTVALTGDGGDESFAGYSHYAQALKWSRADFIPYPIRSMFFGSLKKGLELLPYSNGRARMIRGFGMLGSQFPDRYKMQLSRVKEQEKEMAYTSEFYSLINAAGKQDVVEDELATADISHLSWMMRHDQGHYLPDCLMVKSDVASMANSLELRAPFLDHKLIEYAATIPDKMKRKGGIGKIILKEIAKDLLPDKVLTKRKTGFSIPLDEWFRGELKTLMQDTLLDDSVRKRGIIDPSFMKAMVDQHLSGSRNWGTRLWSFICLELWFRRFID